MLLRVSLNLELRALGAERPRLGVLLNRLRRHCQVLGFFLKFVFIRLDYVVGVVRFGQTRLCRLSLDFLL